MEILEAYCLELKKNITIYEAQRRYFEQPDPRPRFTFGCSYPDCRSSHNPTIVGVNYDKIIEEDGEKYNKPHFKNFRKDSHNPSCLWVERDEAEKELEAEGTTNQGSNRWRKFRYLKSSDVIDIFVPFTKQEDQEAEEELVERLPGGYDLLPKPQRLAYHKERLRLAQTRTNKLEELVSCFENMSSDERDETPLLIRGVPRTTYAQAFSHVKNYSADDRKIYFGGVVFDRAWGEGFSINFMDRFVDGGKKNLLSIYISPEQIKRYRRREYLKSKILALEGKKDFDYAKCYFYGSIVPGKLKGTCNVDIGNLHNFVLILRTKKSK